MSAIDSGGPVSPIHPDTLKFLGELIENTRLSQEKKEAALEELGERSLGLTLRDYFAAKAATGCLPGARVDPGEHARWAYRMADAMLAARKT